jgi:hypothetical protein
MKSTSFCKTIIFSSVLALSYLAHASAQDANDPAKLNLDLNRTEGEIVGAVVAAGKNLALDTEKALKNEAKKDSETEKGLRADVPSSTATSVQDSSLEGDADKLQQEADSLH